MSQFPLFENKEIQQYNLDNGKMYFYPNYLDLESCSYYLKQLKAHLPWQQEVIQMYGKEIPVPRLSSWHGDKESSYTYSGIPLPPNPWNEDLLKLKSICEEASNHTFNSVLANLYRNGNDSVAWHADDEPELGKNPVIASLTFGAERKFQLRHKTTKERIDLILKNGSLLVMQGQLQHYWQHQIPKTKKRIGERMNLTFRRIL